MSDPIAELRAQLARQDTSRRGLFNIYNDLRRQARDSEDAELHQLVAEAYQAFLRAHLTEDTRAFVELQEENARLRAELRQWQTGIKRREA